MRWHDSFSLPHAGERGEPTAALNSPFIMDHNKFIEFMLILMIRISVGQIKIYNPH